MNKEIYQKNIILEQAFLSFTQNGPRNFTIDELSSQMGMSKKTIYKYFPTKNILIDNIFKYFTDSIREKFAEVSRLNDNPIVKFKLVTDFLFNRFNYMSPNTLIEIKIRYPKIWARIAEFRKEMSIHLADFLKEAQKMGLAKSDMDMDKTSTIFLYILNNTFQPEFFIANNLAPADTIKLYMQMITEGLFTEEGVALRNES